MVPPGLRRWLDGGRTGVKVCGVTRESDALAAIGAGADALGFNFFPRSKRAVRLEDVSAWAGELAADIARIAVVVDPDEDLVCRLADSGIFHALQFHGGESPDFCARWGAGFYIKARALAGGESVADVLADPAPCLLLDAHAPGVFGGTGRVIDWSLAAEVVRSTARPVVLSGGLNPGNVAEAVRQVLPAAVDVASGVEFAPGIKDGALMREFVAALRAA